PRAPRGDSRPGELLHAALRETLPAGAFHASGRENPAAEAAWLSGQCSGARKHDQEHGRAWPAGPHAGIIHCRQREWPERETCEASPETDRLAESDLARGCAGG